ncbi:Hpt domain-containing protein [Ktedonospora formicarum]|nr:Hpt domain-containing protein [Ktedonospora formicarum]
MSNTFDKLSVLDSFIEEVNSYLPEIEKNLERLALTPNDMDALEETHRRTHTIGGSASMMDLPGLAHVAHGMEDILGDALDGLTTLDEPLLGLLHRSLGRLHQLIEGIRSGIDEDAVIAEDDADYARYRAEVDASSETAPPQMTGAHSFPLDSLASFSTMQEPGYSPQFGAPLPPITPGTSAMPSFDEVLESFRTPSSSQDEDMEWPGESIEELSHPQQQTQSPPPFSQPVQPAASSASALEELMASMRGMPSAPPNTPFSGNPPSVPDVASSAPSLENYHASSAPQESTYLEPETQQNDVIQPDLSDLSRFSPVDIEQWPRTTDSSRNMAPQVETPFGTEANQQSIPAWETSYQPFASEPEATSLPVAPTSPAQLNVQGASLSASYEVAQRETQNLTSIFATMQEVTSQLRLSIEIIEEQRKEFKGFLDGSKDALDRMEDWAGRAMGLNLRNSPEQVRRYLPLSVMWVSNSKLKKVLERLNHISSGFETTDEQVHWTIQQIQTAVESCSLEFQQLQERLQQTQNEPLFRQKEGWSSWEMQRSQNPETLRERVTFERQGDIQALRAEIASQVRGELEPQVREEVRREYESQAQWQSANAQAASLPRLGESMSDLERRLRNEIEIQVRQEFLGQISTLGPSALGLGSATTPSTQDAQNSAATNYLDRARQSLGGEVAHQPSQQPKAPTSQSVAPTYSQPHIPAQTPAKPAAPPQPAPAFNSDFGDEAAEIFRLEAEEHLQSISVHVAALESDPNNRDLIQGIRRATHTLKGAAGMMGFRSISDLSHASEDLLDSVMEGNTPITPAVVSVILDTAETLDSMVVHLDKPLSDDDAKAEALRMRYASILGTTLPLRLQCPIV